MAKNDRFIVLAFGEEPSDDDSDYGGPAPKKAGMPKATATGSRAERPALDVKVGKLGAGEREAIETSPRHFSARPMPICLVKPKNRSRAKASAVGEVQWGITAVGADKEGGRTGAGVVVAVLDTGIAKDYKTHPAFKGVDVVLENFTNEVAHDTDGHGTHCAGTILGRNVNGTRIGVAPGVERVLIGKVLGERGGSTESIVKAIQWAADEGAHVISMSLGIDFPGMVEEMRAQKIPGPRATSEALAAYRDTVRLFDKLTAFLQAKAGYSAEGVLLVGAAGNESNRPLYTIDCSPPAKAEGILPVAAVSVQLKIAKFSNTGALLAAPGVDIVSAAPGGGLQSMSGTSMAAPHVAGVAALWTEELIKQGAFGGGVGVMSKIIASAKPLAGLDFTAVGHGLVQAP